VICNDMNLVVAMRICTEAHRAQKDKAGNAYILHPLRVAAAGTDLDQVVLGLLHDVVEDNPLFTLSYIKENGFPDELIEALDAISKRAGESREDYLYRVAQNGLATIVKFNDFDNNSNPDRLALLPREKAMWLAVKYNEARDILMKYVIERNRKQEGQE
jgi:hypothetical protein